MKLNFFLIALFALMSIPAGASASCQDMGGLAFRLKIVSGEISQIYGKDRFPRGESVTFYAGTHTENYPLPPVLHLENMRVKFTHKVELPDKLVADKYLTICKEHVRSLPGEYNLFMIRGSSGKALCLLKSSLTINMASLRSWTWYEATRPCVP